MQNYKNIKKIQMKQMLDEFSFSSTPSKALVTMQYCTKIVSHELEQKKCIDVIVL